MISTHAIGCIKYISRMSIHKSNPDFTFIDLTILCNPGRTKYPRIHRLVPVHVDCRAYGFLAESIHRECSIGDTIECIGIMERMRGLTSAHLVNKLKIERWELIRGRERSNDNSGEYKQDQ